MSDVVLTPLTGRAASYHSINLSGGVREIASPALVPTATITFSGS